MPLTGIGARGCRLAGSSVARSSGRLEAQAFVPFPHLQDRMPSRERTASRIRQRDRLFVGPFNAEKVQGGGECECQWPCCALLRFKTHVGGQDASLMQRLRILCSIGHAGECIGSLM